MNMFEWRRIREVNLMHLEMLETERPNWRGKNGYPGSRDPKKGLKKRGK